MLYQEYENKVHAIPYDRNNVRHYHEQVAEVNTQFAAALAEESGLSEYPTIANKVWEMAWERGHASGYADIENVYYDYVELVRVVMRGR